MTTSLSKYEYLPLFDGATIEYKVIDFTGIWYPDNFKLDIFTRQGRTDHVRVTSGLSSCPAFTGFAQFWHTLDFPDLPIRPGMSLRNGLTVSENGLYYLGEAINEFGNFTSPYIAILTNSPVAGERIEGKSKTYLSCKDSTLLRDDYLWSYRTIQHYELWGIFPDVWRTALWEHETNHVYNYAFAKDIGMVNIWHGFMDVNGNVVGTEYYALLGL